MSEEIRPTTCRLDPEVDLIESALPPTKEDVESEAPDSEAVELLEPEERAEVEATLAALDPELKSIEPSDIQPFRGGAAAAIRNTKATVKTLAPFQERLRKELPLLEHHRIERLAKVAVALAYVVASAARKRKVGTSRKSQNANMYRIRRLLLSSLNAAALKELVPQEEVDAIAAGRGIADALEDILAMIAVFVERWEVLQNNTPVDRSDLDEAWAIAEAMYPRVRADGGVDPEPTEPDDLDDLRDRLWTLLLRDYQEAVAAMTWLSRGKEKVEIPPLLAGARRPAVAKTDEKAKVSEQVAASSEDEKKTG